MSTSAFALSPIHLGSRQCSYLSPAVSVRSMQNGASLSSFLASRKAFQSNMSPVSANAASAKAVLAEEPKKTIRVPQNIDDALVSSITTMEKFWELADESKLNAQYSSDGKIEFLKHASADEVRKICLQYRYFVRDYPDNLSSLVGKLPYGELKSLLAEILSEELGSGKQAGAHIVWYDRFLRSIGVTDEELESSLYPENAALLDEIAFRCRNKSAQHVIGVCGMGGECLCQIYLTNMQKYLVQNKFIQEINDQIDWHFWDYHIGEDDIAHRQLVRSAINRMVIDENGIRDLAEGYNWGKHIWDIFWTNNYKETRAWA